MVDLHIHSPSELEAARVTIISASTVSVGFLGVTNNEAPWGLHSERMGSTTSESREKHLKAAAWSSQVVRKSSMSAQPRHYARLERKLAQDTLHGASELCGA